MIIENTVLEVVGKITPSKSYFFAGTLFVETTDSEIAVRVFNSLRKEITAALAFGKVGNETYYDFL
jgi:hypothetical protein